MPVDRGARVGMSVDRGARIGYVLTNYGRDARIWELGLVMI